MSVLIVFWLPHPVYDQCTAGALAVIRALSLQTVSVHRSALLAPGYRPHGGTALAFGTSVL